MRLKAENDLKLVEYQRALHKRMDPLNLALRSGRLDTAFLIAMEMEDAARNLQRRLNELKYDPDEV